MTRLLTCGFETGDINESGATFFGANATLTVVNTAPVPRAGAYCLKAAPQGSSTGQTAYKTWTLPAPKTDLWVRFVAYFNAGNLGGNAIVFAGANDASAGAQTCLTWDASTQNIAARLGVSNGGTVLATSTSPATAGAWHLVEWRVQITSATAGVIEVWLDGNRVINFSGDNTSSAVLNVQQIVLGNVAASLISSASYWVAIDDLAINDTAGTLNNGRPGDGRVVLLVPNGAGSNTGLTRGGTDTGANWSQTNELPPSMTQYVLSATAAARDTYALQDLPVTPSAINCCEVVALAQNSDAGAGSLGLTVKSGATTNEGSAQALGTSAAYFRQLYETDPATSVAWTAAGVNALEAGVTVR